MTRPEFVKIKEDHYISNRGIMSIKQDVYGTIYVRYVSGYSETVTTMTMSELLTKLGRMPGRAKSADSP